MSVDRAVVNRHADSLDGRAFTYRVPQGYPLVPGDLMLLRTVDGGQYLGQVREQEPVTSSEFGGTVGGFGSIIGAIGPEGASLRPARTPFLRAGVEAASAAHLGALQAAAGADLPVGRWRSGGVETSARLRAKGFNRHTFLCGQSGSGKTYALGVLLEQLLIATELRMVVLDPNADFVRLGETRPDAPDDARRRLAPSEVRVLRAAAAGGEKLRMRFATMPRRAQAAVLELDPVADRGEYNQFVHTMANLKSPNVKELIDDLIQGRADERALAQRIENLGLGEWEVWAGELESAAEVVDGGARATVLDLGGFGHPLEPLAVSLDLLENLWRQRETRTPMLIVIDEAHNLCTAEPTSPLQAAVTERLIQIAAEGRKYGLWLLLSTQRPSKIHPQVLSQCDNLALMRMNSRADLAELSAVFGFVPPAMLQASQSFAQGEVLIAGTFAPVPAVIQIGPRLTFEGGSDVSVPILTAQM